MLLDFQRYHMLPRQRQENKILYDNHSDSEPFVYQTKSRFKLKGRFNNGIGKKLASYRCKLQKCWWDIISYKFCDPYKPLPGLFEEYLPEHKLIYYGNQHSVFCYCFSLCTVLNVAWLFYILNHRSNRFVMTGIWIISYDIAHICDKHWIILYQRFQLILKGGIYFVNAGRIFFF